MNDILTTLNSIKSKTKFGVKTHKSTQQELQTSNCTNRHSKDTFRYT